jgi:hypothetical protein
VELIDAALAALEVRSARAVARFAVHCRCADALLPLVDHPAIAQHLALDSPDFMQAHATPTLLFACVRALRALCQVPAAAAVAAAGDLDHR